MDRLAQCKAVYKEAFGDEAEFEQLLFENCYSFCETIEQNGQVASLLFALPCVIKSSSEIREAIYIFAAATKEEYRKKGLMSTLIKKVVLKNKEKIIFLRPATKELISFYERLGFIKTNGEAYKQGECYVIPCKEYLNLAEPYVEDNGQNFDLMYFSAEKTKIEKIAFAYSME